MNCHFNNLAFDRSPFVNPQMREHSLIVSATYAKVQFTSEMVLTDKASNNADTDIDAGAMCQSHQAKRSKSLPFQQFQALLIIFSKSFASVLHCSCSLSVSNKYFALDEVYHPLCAPLPRNVTLRVHTIRAGLQMTDRTLTRSGKRLQEVCICSHAGIASCDHKSRLESLDFHAEPIPIHSPLLRKHYSDSFPPLTYLLKFSKFSGLTACLRIQRYTHWGGLITRYITPEEDAQSCACPAPPRHMCQRNEFCIET